MLQELTITNFAIIDHLRLAPGEHLNVFTGETGAGKSIILDAISALVGERLGADVVRAGSERATIEGVFDVSSLLPNAGKNGATAGANHGGKAEAAIGETAGEAQNETLADILNELGIEVEEGQLILTREIARTGRNVARVNGRATTLASLQRITTQLIDIHGQSAHLAILRPERHIYYLDRFASADDLREQVSRLVSEWRATRREYERLRRDEREIERRSELLRYQVEEITTARLVPGELEELERERRRLANAERLEDLCSAIYGALAGDERNESPGALAQLTTTRRAMSDLLRLDDTLREQNETLDQAYYLLEEVASSTRAYQEEIAADPQRQAEVEERIDLIARLRRKYGATIEDILTFAEEAARELDELSHRDERAAALQRQEIALRTRIGALAGQLSARRQAASEALAAAMERELDDLNMRRARFQAQISRQPDATGAPVVGPDGAEARFAFSATGIDQVEFLIAPNPGEPFKPLARIASGGETSRLMLALKTILSSADATPILIFDEIDSGISGRSGQVVGEKLWALAQAHQVLCVTHLPQIAAMGDDHFHVAKIIQGERTTTEAQRLTPEQRVEEIGQMLGGANTRAARANAAELIERANEWKRTQAPTPTLASS